VKNYEVCSLKDPVLVSEKKCKNYGKKLEVQDHNVTVEIPKGAIEKGDIVEVEVAASLFGQHKLPKGYTRISSFVWIGASYNFKKPLKIEVEHHAVVAKEADISQFCVMEVCKENRTDPHTDEERMCEAIQVYSSHCEIGHTFYIYHTHSKLTCLAKRSAKIADEVVVYQFLPKNYTEVEDFIVEICFCCNLKFLRKVCRLLHLSYYRNTYGYVCQNSEKEIKFFYLVAYLLHHIIGLIFEYCSMHNRYAIGQDLILNAFWKFLTFILILTFLPTCHYLLHDSKTILHRHRYNARMHYSAVREKV